MLRRGNSVGIEIDDKGLVAVSLKRSGKLIYVSNSGRYDFDLDSKPEDELAARLKSWATEFGVQGSQVSLAVSGSDVYHQVFSLPVMSNAELSRVIERRIAKDYPFPEGDLLYDYSVLGEISERGARRLLVLVVILKRSVVYKVVHLFQKADLLVNRIVTRPLSHLALAGDARYLSRGEHGAAVSIGHGTISVNFLSGDRLQFCRDTSMVTASHDPRPESGQKASTDFYVRLEREVKRSIDWYKRQPHGEDLEKLIVFDYGRNPDMPKYMTGMLGIDVDEFDPSRHLNIQFSSRAELDNPGQIETALGCAIGGGILDSINLLPPEFREQREAMARRVSTIAVLAIIGAILAGGYGLLNMAEDHYSKAVMNQRSELFKLRHYSSQHKDLLDERTMLEEKRYSLEYFTRDRIDWGLLYSRIGDYVPEHTLLTDIVVSRNMAPLSSGDGNQVDTYWTMILEGMVVGMDQLATQSELAILLEGLESSGMVQDMRFEFLRESGHEDQAKGKGFQITARIKHDHLKIAGN